MTRLFTKELLSTPQHEPYGMTSAVNFYFDEDDIFELSDEGLLFIRLPVYREDLGNGIARYEIADDDSDAVQRVVAVPFGGFVVHDFDDGVYIHAGGEAGGYPFLFIPTDSVLGLVLKARGLVDETEVAEELVKEIIRKGSGQREVAYAVQALGITPSVAAALRKRLLAIWPRSERFDEIRPDPFAVVHEVGGLALSAEEREIAIAVAYGESALKELLENFNKYRYPDLSGF